MKKMYFRIKLKKGMKKREEEMAKHGVEIFCS
jgi:hypothetical protein